MPQAFFDDDIRALLTERKRLAPICIDFEASEEDRDRLRAVDKCLLRIRRAAYEERRVWRRKELQNTQRLAYLDGVITAIEESGVSIPLDLIIPAEEALMRGARRIRRLLPTDHERACHLEKDLDRLLEPEAQIGDVDGLMNAPDPD